MKKETIDFEKCSEISTKISRILNGSNLSFAEIMLTKAMVDDFQGKLELHLWMSNLSAKAFQKQLDEFKGDRNE
jgi:hypothetical protein